MENSEEFSEPSVGGKRQKRVLTQSEEPQIGKTTPRRLPHKHEPFSVGKGNSVHEELCFTANEFLL